MGNPRNVYCRVFVGGEIFVAERLALVFCLRGCHFRGGAGACDNSVGIGVVKVSVFCETQIV